MIVMLKKLWLLGVLLAVSACTESIVGATLVSAYFLGSASNISETAEELKVESEIKDSLKSIKKNRAEVDYEADVFARDGHIYIIGIAKNQASKRAAMDPIAPKYRGYKVVDELKIKPSMERASVKDFWLRNLIRQKFIFTNGIRSANYSVTSFDANVFVVGTALSAAESRLVIDEMTGTRGVKSVINYIEIKDIGD